MAGIKAIVKTTTKKHGVKAGQKSLVKPSQKKSVKNGRYQEKEVSKKKVAKAVKAIPAKSLEADELDDFLQEPEFDDLVDLPWTTGTLVTPVLDDPDEETDGQ
jgi:hypothetical protein